MAASKSACKERPMKSAVQQSARPAPDARAGSSASLDIRYAVGQCSLGVVVVAASERGIRAILLGDGSAALVRDLQERFPDRRVVQAGAGSLDRLVAKVIELVESPGIGLDVPLDTHGTDFQERVWLALREIPAGATATYTDIA